MVYPKVTYSKVCKRCGGRLVVLFGKLVCINRCDRNAGSKTIQPQARRS